VRKDLNDGERPSACWAEMIQAVKVAASMPMIEPTAAPIRVFSDALRMRV
jgi:hypothetical protein